MKHPSVGKRVRVLSRGFQVELEGSVPDKSPILEPEGFLGVQKESRRNLENPWKTLEDLGRPEVCKRDSLAVQHSHVPREQCMPCSIPGGDLKEELRVTLLASEEVWGKWVTRTFLR